MRHDGLLLRSSAKSPYFEHFSGHKTQLNGPEMGEESVGHSTFPPLPPPNAPIRPRHGAQAFSFSLHKLLLPGTAPAAAAMTGHDGYDGFCRFRRSLYF